MTTNNQPAAQVTHHYSSIENTQVFRGGEEVSLLKTAFKYVRLFYTNIVLRGL